MFFLPGDEGLILSPSDLRTAAECEFRLLRQLDVLLGRRDPLPAEDDQMLERIKELGNLHEQAELRRLAAVHPGRVRTMSRPEHSRAGYEAGMRATVDALTSAAEVLGQATFFDGSFLGYADFLERTEAGWLVSDTKLARLANVPALLQIAAYAAMLLSLDVPVAPVARLVLGSGDVADYPLRDIVPVYRRRRERLEELIARHRRASAPVEWGDPDAFVCGRCEECESVAAEHRDLLLVAGMRPTTRRRLRDAGITTIEELADSTGAVPEVRQARLDRLRAQAHLQVRQDRDPQGRVLSEVVDEAALRRLPAPRAGDVFFDFEGDPLWRERGSSVWGLEYLFGLVEIDTGTPQFTAFWAHDRAAEKHALERFVAHVHARRKRWPDLHIYHYAPYETAALTRLAARHSTCEDDIDEFLRSGIFVDLYATVRGGIQVSQRSYSIKKLEPLYMEGRAADLKKGDDSIVQYHLFMAARDTGDESRAQALLEGIADYNREDCISTWLLRDWLIAQTGDGVVGAPAPQAPEPRPPSDRRRGQLALEASVRALVEDVPVADRSPDDQAVAMIASSVLFHAREDKPVWWKHFDRLKYPTEQWQRDPGTALVEGSPELVDDWHVPPRARSPRRRYWIRVDPIGGTLLSPGACYALYAAPPAFEPPSDHDPANAHAKGTGSVTIEDAEELLADNGRVQQRLLVVENAPGGTPIEDFPVAFVPTGPIGSGPLDAALEELAVAARAAHPRMLEQSGVDVLLRRPPRLRGGGTLPSLGEGDDRFINAISSALRGMDDSYLAVQGPPGTGKTYVGARVIARLVGEHGWRVGVCAQSHAAIENVLDAVVAAGVPPEQVAKVPKHSSAPPWTPLASANDLAAFAAAHAVEGRGYVLGGTAWDLTNLKRVERGQLDLVVIDEAGQFSLAKTLAVSLAGARLLLLGDPAQLPQVVQGTHSEPIDESALGWLIGDESVLPREFGYFLETTWRMHPALTEAVSGLSYAGQLRSRTDVTSARSLEGIEPGLHLRLVEHVDNSRYSPEEAQEVVAVITELLGRTWVAPDEEGGAGGRPLTLDDVIVITPYNAQVGTIQAALRDSGLSEVAVGTVDKFQGREAAVAIVSMAASAAGDVSRGIGFLLDRQRLNVAISRGKHAAYLVRSAALTDFPPRTPAELVALGAFLGLCERALPDQAS